MRCIQDLRRRFIDLSIQPPRVSSPRRFSAKTAPTTSPRRVRYIKFSGAASAFALALLAADRPVGRTDAHGLAWCGRRLIGPRLEIDPATRRELGLVSDHTEGDAIHIWNFSAAELKCIVGACLLAWPVAGCITTAHTVASNRPSQEFRDGTATTNRLDEVSGLWVNNARLASRRESLVGGT